MKKLDTHTEKLKQWQPFENFKGSTSYIWYAELCIPAMYGPAVVDLHIPFPSWIRTLLPINTIGRYLTSIPTVVIGWYLLAKDSNLSQVQMKLTSNIQPQVDQLTQNQIDNASDQVENASPFIFIQTVGVFQHNSTITLLPGNKSF